MTKEQINDVFRIYNYNAKHERGGDFLSPKEMLEDWELFCLMADSELREELYEKLAPCSNEEFLANYLVKHSEKFEELFIIN